MSLMSSDDKHDRGEERVRGFEEKCQRSHSQDNMCMFGEAQEISTMSVQVCSGKSSKQFIKFSIATKDIQFTVVNCVTAPSYDVMLQLST